MTVSSRPDITRALCDAIASTTLDDVPPDVVERTKHLILDGIGCGLLASRLPWSELAVQTVRRLEGEVEGRATVFGWDASLSAPAAALLNGTFIQGFELDDYHQFGPLHSESCVLPAVLGTAEAEGGLDGRRALEAILLGFEVGPRVGMSLGGLALVSRGFHCGSVFGALAAGVGAAKARGLEPDRIEDAIGIAATQAAGLMSAQYEAMVKRMHSGFAARAGLYAAALAAAGFSGIKAVIERDYGGFASTFSSEVHLNRLLADFGERWEVMRIVVKPPYSCMGGLHAGIDGILQFRDETAVGADDVVSIEAGVAHAMYHHAGWELSRPAETIGAQMNLKYALSVALLDGAAFVPQFSPRRLAAPDVWELMERVRVRHDADLDARGEEARWTTRLRIHLRGGDEWECEVRDPWGGAARPLDNNEIRLKYRRMTALVIPEDRVRRIEEVVLNLERLPDIRELTALIRQPSRSPFDAEAYE